MKKNNRVYYLVEGSMIAALYIVLTYAQEFMVPGTTSMAIQLRLSEVLCVLAVFTPSAVWGLTVGTLISNIMSSSALPLDTIFGTFATFLAVALMYRFKSIRLKGVPLLSLFMPVLSNGIIIALELEIFLIEGPFHIGSFLYQSLTVALGEFIVCVIIGFGFYKLLVHLDFFNKIHKLH
ncbi:MAG: QueT transporter family protein [Ruminococcus sp.]|nr:QueT transporter family protein [Ruminococcus sp.]